MRQYALCALAALALTGCKNLTGSDLEDLGSRDVNLDKGIDRPAAACIDAAREATRAATWYHQAVGRVRTGQAGLEDANSAFENLVAAHKEMVAVCAGEQTYTIGGSVTGLGDDASVMIQNNGTDDLIVTAAGDFTFATELADGEMFNVTVGVHPVDQVCTVVGGSGIIEGGHVTDVQVDCIDLPSVVGSPTAVGDLVITEFMSNPAAVTDAAGEWFEVYNPTATAFELMGLVLRDDGSNEFTVGTSLVIQPGAFLVFGANADQAINGGAPVDFVYGSFTLANSSDEIELVNGQTVIDRVAYGTGFPLVAGQATSLDEGSLDAVANDNGGNWCSARQVMSGGDLGSPGATNGICQ